MVGSTLAEQWVKYNPAYIRFEKQESVNSVVGKRVVSKVDNLRFYDTPSWQDSAVAGTLDAGKDLQSMRR